MTMKRNKQANNRKVKQVADFVPVDQGKERPNVSIKALNEGQGEYIDSLKNCPCTIAIGSAGTGKTFVAASIAAQDLAKREIDTIILSRPNVPTGKSLGAFPGTVEEKMEPWLMSITTTLKRQLGVGFYEHAVKTGAIQIQPVETIRGRSFDNAMLLFDESQQLEVDEIKAIVTRIGKDSRLVLMGDITQRDNTGKGLEYLIDLADRHHLPVEVHEFTSDDIVRSDTCKMFVKAFEVQAELDEKAKVRIALERSRVGS
jgi:phosphate starvation-inducible PhoH-like protein